MVIYDEAHHCASRVFSRSLMKNGGIYTLALSAVTIAQIQNNLLSDTHIVSIAIADTSVNIAANIDMLQALGNKVTTISQLGTLSAMAISASQFTADAATIAKITGTYTLSVSGVLAVNVSNVLTNTHVTSITVSDSAANITTNLSKFPSFDEKFDDTT